MNIICYPTRKEKAMNKKQSGSTKISFCIVVLFIMICGVFMLSCGIKIIDPSKTGPAKTLRKNALALDREHGFTALAVWSLRIQDQTGQLKGMKPKFGIGSVGATERLCKYLKTGKVQVQMNPKEYLSSHASVKPIDGFWTEKSGQAIYNALFAVELRPGEHQIFQILLESENAYIEQWVNIPLNATCRIVQGKVYDLNLLEIVFTDKIQKKKGQNIYRYSIHSPAMATSNKEKLTRLCPSLVLPISSMVSDCSFVFPVCDD
jgi:hypothetical protein